MSGRERIIAAALSLTVIGSGGFIAAYATGGSRLYEGGALALAFAGLCAAALGWAFWVVGHEQVVDELEDYPSPAAERAGEVRLLREDLAEISRSRVLLRLLYAALGTLGLALIVPLRSLGPRIGDTLFHTSWRKGDRLTRPDGSFVHVSDLNVDSVAIVFPENAIGDAQSQATLIRLPQSLAGAAAGYVAYSRVCTHAGCPVALYRASAKELMCPCHQSVFDVVDNGSVVSGPADHALPQLPIEVDPSGYLRAKGDFPEPIGPGFWERG